MLLFLETGASIISKFKDDAFKDNSFEVLGLIVEHSIIKMEGSIFSNRLSELNTLETASPLGSIVIKTSISLEA